MQLRRRNAEPFVSRERTDTSHSSAFPRTSQYFGYLDVRTSKTKPWKRRYFMVNNNFLLSAATPHAEKLDQVIPLDRSTIKSTTDVTFVMKIRKHTLYFRAPSPTICTKWTNALYKASKLKIRDIYRFLYTLGQSEITNSSVVSSQHRLSHEESAIKIIDKRQIGKANKRKLTETIQILKKIDNKYIVKIYDLIEFKKYFYMVMEKCNGGTLFNQIKEKYKNLAWKFDENLCCNIISQIVSGIEYMHKMGIILNHLKIDNILCVKPNVIDKIKIADFGLSNCNDKINLTVDQMSYMAPELLSNQTFIISNIPQQFQNILHHFYRNIPLDIVTLLARFYYNIDRAADSWSLGVIMCVLFVGCKPFLGKDLKELSNSILNDDITNVFDGKDWDHVSNETKYLLNGLLTKNPFERTPCDNVLKSNLKFALTLNKFQCST